MIEAVIFDVDGTLVDSVDAHARAWLWVFARHGHDIPLEDIHFQIGKGGDQLMPVFLSEEEIARVGETLFDELRTPVRRIGTPMVPMPFSPDLEKALMPTSKAVATAAEALVREG